MFEPSTILQTAIRDTLINSADLTALVMPNDIRSGSTRPSNFPTVIMANPQTINLGRAAGGQYCTRVFLDLHIWALEQGSDAAQRIGGIASHLLWDAPIPEGVLIIDYQRPSFAYMRDPDPDKSYAHGVGTVEASILWTL
jgi:hypothetical protein